MNEDNNLFIDAARQLLEGECKPQQVRDIEAGASTQELWAHIEDSGFPDALVPEDSGGAGLTISEVFDVWALCGAHALPVPLAETMVARSLLCLHGVKPPSGSITLAEGALESDGNLRCSNVSLGRVANYVMVENCGKWHLLPTAIATTVQAPFVLDASLKWTAQQLGESVCIDNLLVGAMDVRTLQACLLAAQLAGALQRVFQRTLQFANERQQFGRPIGKFQAIQHQLAIMSEHVFAARMAAQLGCSGDGQENNIWPTRLRVAVAKARCSQAALVVAEAGHAIHGAIGFTAEYDLQLFTRRLHAWRQAAGGESYWHVVAGNALFQHVGSTLDLLREATDVAA